MIALFSGCVQGIDAFFVEIEVDTRPGLPGFEVVGLPGATIRESRERVKSALKNCNLQFPRQKVTVNLAPADLPKDGPLFDLPIALGVLAIQGLVPPSRLNEFVIVGELSLSGHLRPIPGALALAELAFSQGKKLILPASNGLEAAQFGEDHVIPVTSLKQVLSILQGKLAPPTQDHQENTSPKAQKEVSTIHGQFLAKRMLEIAAHGNHHCLLVGPPGVGKTLLAKQVHELMPPLTRDLAMSITKIYSNAGLLASGSGLVTRRPVRIPHHTITPVGLLGGGLRPKPGEITLAHGGVLILDEIPEFHPQALQALREPLETGKIYLSRNNYRLHYPANFLLIGTANPCPCGFLGDSSRECRCNPREIRRYQRRLSGPLLDRIDLFHYLAPIKRAEYHQNDGWPHETMRAARLKTPKKITDHGEEFLLEATQSLPLSVRGYYKTLRVAKTIASLDKASEVDVPHLAEALQYRWESLELF